MKNSEFSPDPDTAPAESPNMGYIPRKKQMDGMQPITRLLLEWGDGNELALEQLTPLVYHELRKLARAYLGRERPDHTLQPTALVHEAYMRLVEQQHQNWESRSHFFGVAAHL